ncbi:glycoside hydrolase family 3 C-terminal domain-containing protein [Limosilactobacillus sp.]|uniref:glycoside hydrolase family 3 C-terminal domain-containing protein n=1 Tax=Limosilactobacillus sp. TaxID=2773925 RepID=UPI003F0F3737
MVKINLDFVEGLTLEERAALVPGKDFWFTARVPDVERMMMSDGPSGLRKQDIDASPADINNSVDAVCFPSSALTASSFDDDMLYKLGTHLGIAANAEHLGVLLGPGVNIKRSPLAGRNFEYFSEDPLLAGRMGVAYVKGVQDQGVGVSVKHFATNNRENQRFTSSSNVDERALREIYLAQFERIVKKAHSATLMCSYNRLNGTLNSQNQRLLTDILRNEWGFEGLVMSDWGAVADHIAALKAGLDLEMPGKGQESVDEIVTAVKEGRLQESTLNRSALRVLKMVEKWGKKVTEAAPYNKEEQHEFARQMADDSIVLLKNDGNQLPLASGQSLAIIGELAAKPRFEGGGSSHVNAHHVVTPLEAAPASAKYAQGYSLEEERPNEKLTADALQLAKSSDQVIFFAGFPEKMETEGLDKDTISLPQNQNELLAQVAAVNSHVTVVLENGSVLEMPWADQVSAIVETYLAGEAVGEATWDILSGKVNPSGKLSESFPLRLQDNPTYGTFGKDHDEEDYHEGIFVGYRYYDLHEMPVRFPFGHGLSYTTFEYSDLAVREGKDTVKVSFRLANTGKVAGKEVAQLYVANHVSRVEMPVKELRDFTKVALKPGESQEVTLTLPRRAFAYYNVDKQQWAADNGEYEIMVGSSSRDIRLSTNFNLTIGVNPTSAVTGNTYVGDLWANQDPHVQKAMKDSGLYELLAPMMKDEQWVAISANIPLRSLSAMGVDEEVRKAFFKLLN